MALEPALEALSQLRFGIEIETSLHAECYRCPWCYLCDVCEKCRREFRCDQCSRVRGRLEDLGIAVEALECDPGSRSASCSLLLSESVYGVSELRPSSSELCNFCMGLQLKYSVCNSCTECRPDCERRKSEPKLLIDMFRKKLYRRAYLDGSCGLEFPFQPVKIEQFQGLLREALPAIKFSSAMDRCGGHLNLSATSICSGVRRSLLETGASRLKGWMEQAERVSARVRASRYFADLLSWISLTRWTSFRSGDRYRKFNPTDDPDPDKYSLVRVRYPLRSPVFEFRFLDPPVYPNSYLVASLALGCIVALDPAHGRFTEYGIRRSKRLYNMLCRGYFQQAWEHLGQVRRKLERFFQEYGHGFGAIRELTGVSLPAEMEKLVLNPPWRTCRDISLG